MSSILDSLTDIGLRRLFKFLLKRAIGRFLIDELEIEQLTVKCRDGIVTLSNLQINCDVLNDDYLISSPCTLVSFSMETLEAKVSYSSLLSDGCKFTVKKINIVLEPRQVDIGKNANNKGDLDNRPLLADEEGVLPLSSQNIGDSAVSFIARWVETVISSLQIIAEDVLISFRQHQSSDGLEGRKFISLSIPRCIFFNAHPDQVEPQDTTVSMTQKQSTMQDPYLGAKKLVKCDGICVNIGRDGVAEMSSDPALYSPAAVTKIMAVDKPVTITIGGRPASGVDSQIVDVVFPMVKGTVHPASLAAVIDVISQYAVAMSPSGDSLNDESSAGTEDDLTLQTLAWLKAKESADILSVESDAIDYAEVIRLIKLYHQEKRRVKLGRLVLSHSAAASSGGFTGFTGDEEVESDGEDFPSDFEDVRSDDADDANSSYLSDHHRHMNEEGKTSSAIHHVKVVSGMTQSLYGRSSLFFSAASGGADDGDTADHPNRDAEQVKKPPSFDIRVHVRSLDLRFAVGVVDTEAEKILRATSRFEDFRDYLAAAEVVNGSASSFSNSQIVQREISLEAEDIMISATTFVASSRSKATLCSSLTVTKLISQEYAWAYESLPSKLLGSKRTLLAFSPYPKIHNIIAAPCMTATIKSGIREFSMDSMTKPMMLSEIDLDLEPPVISIHKVGAMYWTSQLQGAVKDFAATESSSPVTFSIKVPKIDIFLHVDSAYSHEDWIHLFEALDLRAEGEPHASSPLQFNEPWQIIDDVFLVTSPFSPLLHSRGCARVTIDDLILTNCEHAHVDVRADDVVIELCVAGNMREDGNVTFWGCENIIRMHRELCASSSQTHRRLISARRLTPQDFCGDVSGSDIESGGTRGFVGLSPPLPSKEALVAVLICTPRISIDVHQREYNAILVFASALSSSGSQGVSDEDEDASSSGKVVDPGFRLGLLIAADCTSVKIRGSPLYTGESLAFTSQSSGELHSEVDAYAASFIHMFMEAAITPDKLYASFSASQADLSETTMTDSAMNPFIYSYSSNLSEVSSERISPTSSSSSKNVRHLLSSSVKWDGYYSRFQSAQLHSLAVQMILSKEEPFGYGLSSVECLDIHVDLQDFVLQYSPRNDWLNSILRILSPMPPTAALGKRDKIIQRILDQSEATLKATSAATRGEEEEEERGRRQTTAPLLSPHLSPQTALLPFARTTVVVRVSRSYVEYACASADDKDRELRTDVHAVKPRSIASIGLLSIDFVTISGSSRLCLNLGLSEIGIHVAQSSVSLQMTRRFDRNAFLERLGLIRVCSIDRMGVQILFNVMSQRTHPSSTKPISDSETNADVFITMNIGVCQIASCVDSVNLFSEIISNFSKEQNMQSSRRKRFVDDPSIDEPLTSEQHSSPPHPSVVDTAIFNSVSRASWMDQIDNHAFSSPSLNQNIVLSQDEMKLSLIEDFHPNLTKLSVGDKDEVLGNSRVPEVRARWLAAYDYDLGDTSDDGFEPVDSDDEPRESTVSLISGAAISTKVDPTASHDEVASSSQCAPETSEGDLSCRNDSSGSNQTSYFEYAGNYTPAGLGLPPLFAADDIAGLSTRFNMPRPFHSDDLFPIIASLGEVEDHVAMAAEASDDDAESVQSLLDSVDDSSSKEDYLDGDRTRFAPQFDFDESDHDRTQPFFGMRSIMSGSQSMLSFGNARQSAATLRSQERKREWRAKTEESIDFEMDTLAIDQEIDLLLMNTSASGTQDEIVDQMRSPSTFSDGIPALLPEFEEAEGSDGVARSLSLSFLPCPMKSVSGSEMKVLLPIFLHAQPPYEENVRGEDQAGGKSDETASLSMENEQPHQLVQQRGDMLTSSLKTLIVRDVAFDSHAEDLERAWAPTHPSLVTRLALNSERPAVSRIGKTSVDSVADRAHAYETIVCDGGSSLGSEKEQSAHWFEGKPPTIKLHYIPIPSSVIEGHEDLPDAEKQLIPKLVIDIRGAFRFRIFGGLDCVYDPCESSVMEAELLTKSGFQSESQSHPKRSNLLNALIGDDDEEAEDGSGAVKRKPLFPPQAKRVSFTSAKELLPLTTRTENVEQFASHRDLENFVDISFQGLTVLLRSYSRKEGNTSEEVTGTDALSPPTPSPVPDHRLLMSAANFIVSFAHRGSRRRKILGGMKYSKIPVDNSHGLLRLSVASFAVTGPGSNLPSDSKTADAGGDIDCCYEHRLAVALAPLRCFLDASFIDFVRELADLYREVISDQKKEVMPPAAASLEPFFQHLCVDPLRLKIDYKSSALNLKALKEGDYLQLLNIFPLEGLELTLKRVAFSGLNGYAKSASCIVEAWVQDIYGNQMYEILSGTSPFRGLTSIGKGLQELLSIPVRGLRDTAASRNRRIFSSRDPASARSPQAPSRGAEVKQVDVWRELRKGTSKLVHTVARETLHVSHRMSRLVAQGIADLASDSAPHTGGQQTQHTERRAKGQLLSHQGRSAAKLQQPHVKPKAVRIGDDWDAQPNGLRDGLEKAYDSLSRGIQDAAGKVKEVRGAQQHRAVTERGIGSSTSTRRSKAVNVSSDAAGGGGRMYMDLVMQTLPTVLLRPAGGAAEAVSYTLLGLRNDVDPLLKQDEEDVWNVEEEEEGYVRKL